MQAAAGDTGTLSSRNQWFRIGAVYAAAWLGSAKAFFFAVALVVVWAAAGPLVGFSSTWQLTINTATTIVTFLMVFLIQNTQNRDTRAIHLKLDELLRSVEHARDELVDLEDAPDDELQALQDEFARLRSKLNGSG